MTGLGTPPPDDLAGDRPAIAAWYWEAVRVAADDHGCDDCCGCVQELILGAIAAGVVGELVRVSWMPVPVPLHELFAPYRRTRGGLQDRHDAAMRDLWAVQPGRWLSKAERREWIP